MNKGEFIIEKQMDRYSIVLPNKKILHKLFHFLFPETADKYFMVTDYEGSNTYFGKKYWQNHGVNFSEISGENKQLFRSENINFIINDKIDRIKIYIGTKNYPTEKNFDELITIEEDKTIKISTTQFSIINQCLLYLFEHIFYLDFSSLYQREELKKFLQNFIKQSFTGSGHIFVKTLNLKKGFDFKLMLNESNGNTKLYSLGYTDGNWFSNELGNEKKDSLISKFEMFEKINYFYISVFIAIFITGILLITTKLRINIALFAIILILFFSVLNNIYKKVKVVFGFKNTVKLK